MLPGPPCAGFLNEGADDFSVRVEADASSSRKAEVSAPESESEKSLGATSGLSSRGGRSGGQVAEDLCGCA